MRLSSRFFVTLRLDAWPGRFPSDSDSGQPQCGLPASSLRSKRPYASIAALLMRGMVMHRGPPRPRDSSLLGMVST